MFLDLKKAVPVDQDLWISHNIEQNNSKTKEHLALEPISRVKKRVSIKMIIADSLYVTKQMIATLVKEKFYFK